MKRLLTVLPTDLVLNSTSANSVMNLCETFNSVVPCVKIMFTKISEVGVIPPVFRYRIETLDSRVWKQDIIFDNHSNPQMTFDVADPWRLSEFSNQRNVRNVLVSLVGSYPTLEKVTYDFLA